MDTQVKPGEGILWTAVGLAAWESVVTVNHLLKPHAPHGSAWLVPFYIQIFPKAGVVVNVLMELAFIFIFFSFVQATNGWKRTFVICYGSETFLAQLRILVPSLGKAIQGVQTVLALFALGIALALLWRMRMLPTSRTNN